MKDESNDMPAHAADQGKLPCREGERTHANIVLAFIGTLVTGLNFSLTACMGGLQSFDGLPGSVTGSALAWWAFSRKTRAGRPARFLVSAAVVFTTYLLLRNIHNILWSGHGAIW